MMDNFRIERFAFDSWKIWCGGLQRGAGGYAAGIDLLGFIKGNQTNKITRKQ